MNVIIHISRRAIIYYSKIIFNLVIVEPGLKTAVVPSVSLVAIDSSKIGATANISHILVILFHSVIIY